MKKMTVVALVVILVMLTACTTTQVDVNLTPADVTATENTVVVEEVEPAETKEESDKTPAASELVVNEVQAGIDKLVAGLDRNIAATIGGKIWESNGNTIEALSHDVLPAGYPRVFPGVKGNAVYRFDTVSMTVTLTNYDNGVQVKTTTVPFEFAGNTYIHAFKRTQNIDGKDRQMMSAFFISDGILYECEAMDDVDSSNYLAHAMVQQVTPAVSLLAAIDTIVAGLDRNVANSIVSKKWVSNGDTVPAQPNSALPSGYPRVFLGNNGGAVYEFNIANMTLTLTNYENGVEVAKNTVPFELAGNTYINAFKRTQNIDGKDRKMMSVFFIAHGVLYECESMDGIDSSNYLAHSLSN